MKDPKEKAKELVDRFYHERDIEDLLYIQCKKCALICVDELISQCSDYRDIDLGASYEYWKSVKTEIENL